MLASACRGQHVGSTSSSSREWMNKHKQEQKPQLVLFLPTKTDLGVSNFSGHLEKTNSDVLPAWWHHEPHPRGLGVAGGHRGLGIPSHEASRGGRRRFGGGGSRYVGLTARWAKAGLEESGRDFAALEQIESFNLLLKWLVLKCINRGWGGSECQGWGRTSMHQCRAGRSSQHPRASLRKHASSKTVEGAGI